MDIDSPVHPQRYIIDQLPPHHKVKLLHDCPVCGTLAGWLCEGRGICTGRGA